MWTSLAVNSDTFPPRKSNRCFTLKESRLCLHKSCFPSTWTALSELRTTDTSCSVLKQKPRLSPCSCKVKKTAETAQGGRTANDNQSVSLSLSDTERSWRGQVERAVMLQNITFFLLCWDFMLKRIFDVAVLTSVGLDHMPCNTSAYKVCALVTSHLEQEFTALINTHNAATAVFCILYFFLVGYNKHDKRDNTYHMDTQSIASKDLSTLKCI